MRTLADLQNFAAVLALGNRIGAIASQQNHHSDLTLAWGRVGVQVWTHKISGLSESDFVFAAKCERAFAAQEAEGGRPLTPPGGA